MQRDRITSFMRSERHPLRNLTAQIKKHRAYSFKNLSRIAAFYAKSIIQEPFRILENFTQAKKIRDHKLKKDPIFIIGHWRSGTSFLQYLLGQDPQFGYMNKFQVVFPDIFLQSEQFLKPIIQGVPETLNIIRDAQNMSINLDLDSPSELEIALTTMLSPTSIHWGHIFPKNAWNYFDKYLFFDTASEKEIREWKRDNHYLIKKTSLKHDGKQLLIKSPGNTCRINKLLEMYPNARFIFIHRNPYDVFYSNKKLWNNLLDNLALQNFTEQQIEQEIIRVYKKLMSRYLKQRDNIPEGQLVELRFEDFVEEPMSELYSAYNSLHLDKFTDSEPEFREFLSNTTDGKTSNYKYEDRIVSLINKNWDFTFSEWNYPVMETSAYARIG